MLLFKTIIRNPAGQSIFSNEVTRKRFQNFPDVYLSELGFFLFRLFNLKLCQKVSNKGRC